MEKTKLEADIISLHSDESEIEPDFIPTFGEDIIKLKYNFINRFIFFDTYIQIYNHLGTPLAMTANVCITWS